MHLRLGQLRRGNVLQKVLGRQQVARRFGVVQYHEKPAPPALCEVHRGREQPFRELRATRGRAELMLFFDNVGQVPAAFQKVKDLNTAGEGLDFAIRREDQADVPAFERGYGVGAILGRAGRRQRGIGTCLRKALDVHQIHEHAVCVDQEDRTQAITQTMEALDRYQRLRVR